MEDKIFIAITGKSGVGKSFFSTILAQELNAELFSLDKISHLSLEDIIVQQKIKLIFGNDVFNDSNINRKKLGYIVFNNSEKLNILNSISQEFMENYIDNLIDNSNKKYYVFDYALLTKMKYFKMSKFKILVTANNEIRFSRMIARDNVSMEYLLLREKNLPVYDKFSFDAIIDNSKNATQDLIIIAKNIAKKIQTSTD